MVARKKPEICVYRYLGEVPYGQAWKLQKRLQEARITGEIPHVLLLLQHPHTITIGKSGTPKHLRVQEAWLRNQGVELFETDRGGDITYHGPGQLVGYPILDLREIRRDINWYLRQLEEAIIRTLAEYGIKAGRTEGLTGVWVGDAKIAAIGIRIRQWVTMHGFALNVRTDLRFFGYIVPCGIPDKGVCSMQEFAAHAAVENVIGRLVDHFGEVFGLRMMPFNHYSWPAVSRIFEEFKLEEPSLQGAVQPQRE
jgi:lipoate-protein ligase B